MKWTLIIIGIISLAVSLYWGISGKQWLEPWTAVLSAMLFLIGIFFTPDSNTKESENSIEQSNFVGFFNSNKVKNFIGKVRQINIFSLGNKQEIEK
jgi:purine-cytosine permease-like protein